MNLRERFEELRGEERAVVPRFQWRTGASPVRRGTGEGARPPLALVACVLLVFIATAMLFVQREKGFTADDRTAARAIAEWRPSTDFLLRTPGRELLTTTPSIPSKGVTR